MGRRKVHREPIDAIAKFWRNVEVRGPDECWRWTGRTDRDGYGRFCVRRKTRGAHRIAFTDSQGEDIDSLHSTVLVCHSCDTPCCCNPAHLFTGTSLDNNRDRTEKGRSAKGADQHLSKLDDSRVRRIRELSEKGFMQVELALMFGVTQGTIGKILRGETWKHVLRRVRRTKVKPSA